MTLTSTVNDKSVKEVTYPCLKQTSYGKVVLFGSPTCGIVMVQGECVDPIGYYSKGWNPIHFEPFTGSVTLTQE